MVNFQNFMILLIPSTGRKQMHIVFFIFIYIKIAHKIVYKPSILVIKLQDKFKVHSFVSVFSPSI